MSFETIIIVALICIVAGLIWTMLGLMDDRRRLSCALHLTHSIVSAEEWTRIIEEYDRALDLDRE